MGLYGSTITAIQLWTILAGVFLPIIVALVTKYETHQSVRSILLLVLTAVSTVLNQFINGPSGFDWGQAILGAIVTFIIAVATLFGVWKPTGVNEAAKKAIVK